ncbi:MAG: nuclear transport factor 2 family protein, partial [Zoogloea sp.]|nr:nuclear transport factor 2 family protein [Zoogloea sp.]
KEEAKPASTPAPRDDLAAKGADATRAVQSWASAWSRKDVRAYLAHYARDFDTPGGASRKAWEQEREQRLTKPGKIEVELENVRVVSFENDRATVKFRQHYRSSNLSTSSNKTLVMVKHDGHWVIQQERVGG